MVQFEAWHGKTLAEHEALRNQWLLRDTGLSR